MVIDFDKKSHTYTIDDVPVPSVTTVIKATVPTPFTAAAWWGWKLGVEAAWEAYKPSVLSPEELAELGKATNFRPDVVRDTAAARGTLIHDAIEQWAKHQKTIDLNDYVPALARLIIGFNRWLEKNEPEFIEVEQIVGYKAHGYAGMLDAEVVFHAGEHQGLRARLDWKSSKRIYPAQHFPQIEAYDCAARRMTKRDSDIRGVVHLPESGRIKLHASTYEYADFYVLLRAYRQMQTHVS